MNDNENIYWNNFYKNFNYIEPSSFAIFILEYLQLLNIAQSNKKFKILDLGCGNGRDSYYLSKKYNVIGIDISNKPQADELNDILNCEFVLGDMITYDKTDFNLIYSRFTFHSITDEQQENLIKSIKPNTILCIETRSIKGLNTFRLHGDSHYRNLTDIDKLKELLFKYNFEISYIVESDGLAIYKSENPICIRVICKN